MKARTPCVALDAATRFRQSADREALQRYAFHHARELGAAPHLGRRRRAAPPALAMATLSQALGATPTSSRKGVDGRGRVFLPYAASRIKRL